MQPVQIPCVRANPGTHMGCMRSSGRSEKKDRLHRGKNSEIRYDSATRAHLICCSFHGQQNTPPQVRAECSVAALPSCNANKSEIGTCRTFKL